MAVVETSEEELLLLFVVCALFMYKFGRFICKEKYKWMRRKKIRK